MFHENLVGKVFKAPKEVFESEQFYVVGQDTAPDYNVLRQPWFLQVREYQDGVSSGPWISVTLKEFKEWNPNVELTVIQRKADPVSIRATEPCCGEDSICRLRNELRGPEEGELQSVAQLSDSGNGGDGGRVPGHLVHPTGAPEPAVDQ